MAQKIKLSTIAETLGVSTATVSLALRDSPLVATETRDKIKEEARSLGVNTGSLRLVVIICATLMTAASVAVSGMIGWVGLVIPQLGRMLVGNDYRRLLPASMLMGAGFLVALTGDVMTMPGLPKVPAAEKIDVDENGRISGLF